MLTPIEMDALLLSLKVSGFAMLWALPLAVFVAHIFATRDFVGKLILEGIVHAPLVLPPVIVGYLLLLTLNPVSGFGAWLQNSFGITLAFSWAGAALAAGIMAFPLMVRAIRLGFETQDPRLVDAARTLGATPLKAFFTISLPLAFPGLLAGLLLGFARALGEFGATITFVSNIPGVTQTLPLALFNATQDPAGDEAAFTLMVLSLILAFAALIISEVLLRRHKKMGQRK
jgi:molybdate transport system permease protein